MGSGVLVLFAPWIPKFLDQIGKKLDRLLGLRNKAIVHLEEGRSIREIASALGIPDKAHKWLSGGEWSSEHLVRGLLRDAGRLD